MEVTSLNINPSDGIISPNGDGVRDVLQIQGEVKIKLTDSLGNQGNAPFEYCLLQKSEIAELGAQKEIEMCGSDPPFSPGAREVTIPLSFLSFGEPVTDGIYTYRIEHIFLRRKISGGAEGKEKVVATNVLEGTFIVDTTPPELESINGEAPKESYFYEIPDVPEIIIDVRDNLSGVARVTGLRDGEECAVQALGGGKYRLCSFAGLREGCYNIKIEVTDRAGNRTEHAFLVGIAPEVSVTSFRLNVLGVAGGPTGSVPEELNYNLFNFSHLYFSPNGDGLGDEVIVFAAVEAVPQGDESDYAQNASRYIIKLSEEIGKEGEVVSTLQGEAPIFPLRTSSVFLSAFFFWDGKDVNGATVSDGLYNYHSELSVERVILECGVIKYTKKVTSVSLDGEVTVDTVPPEFISFNFHSPDVEEEVYDSTELDAYIEARDELSGIAGVLLKDQRNNIYAMELTSADTYYFHLKDLECNLNEVKADVYDMALNRVEETLNIRVIDTVPPELVGINFYEPITYYIEDSNKPTYWFTYLEETCGLDKLNITIDSYNYEITETTEEGPTFRFTFGVGSNPLEWGEHNVKIQATDKHGNISAPYEFTLWVPADQNLAAAPATGVITPESGGVIAFEPYSEFYPGKITVPPGAVTETVVITYGDLGYAADFFLNYPPELTTHLLLSKVLTIRSYFHSYTKPVIFSKPVTVVIPLRKDMLDNIPKDLSNLKIVSLNHHNHSYEFVAPENIEEMNFDIGYVKIRISHLSSYVVLSFEETGYGYYEVLAGHTNFCPALTPISVVKEFPYTHCEIYEHWYCLEFTEHRYCLEFTNCLEFTKNNHCNKFVLLPDALLITGYSEEFWNLEMTSLQDILSYSDSYNNWLPQYSHIPMALVLKRVEFAHNSECNHSGCIKRNGPWGNFHLWAGFERHGSRACEHWPLSGEDCIFFSDRNIPGQVKNDKGDLCEFYDSHFPFSRWLSASNEAAQKIAQAACPDYIIEQFQKLPSLYCYNTSSGERKCININKSIILEQNVDYTPRIFYKDMVVLPLGQNEYYAVRKKDLYFQIYESDEGYNNDTKIKYHISMDDLIPPTDQRVRVNWAWNSEFIRVVGESELHNPIDNHEEYYLVDFRIRSYPEEDMCLYFFKLPECCAYDKWPPDKRREDYSICGWLDCIEQNQGGPGYCCSLYNNDVRIEGINICAISKALLTTIVQAVIQIYRNIYGEAIRFIIKLLELFWKPIVETIKAIAQSEGGGGCSATSAMVDIYPTDDNIAYLNELREFRDQVLQNNPALGVKAIATYYYYSNELIKIFEQEPTTAQFYSELLYFYRQDVESVLSNPGSMIEDQANKPITSEDIQNFRTFISYILPYADDRFANVLKDVAYVLPQFEGKPRKDLLDYVFKLHVLKILP